MRVGWRQIMSAGGVCCQERRRCCRHCRPVPIYMHRNCPGNASFKNWAMLSHTQMTNTFQAVHKVNPGGGSALWRNWQLGRWCTMGGALLKWRDGFGTYLEKNERRLDQKNKKPDRPSLSHKKRTSAPPSITISRMHFFLPFCTAQWQSKVTQPPTNSWWVVDPFQLWYEVLRFSSRVGVLTDCTNCKQWFGQRF